MVKAQEQNIPNLKVVFNVDKPGISAARNLGIKEANGSKDNKQNVSRVTQSSGV